MSKKVEKKIETVGDLATKSNVVSISDVEPVAFSSVYRGSLGALPITELLNMEIIIEDIEFVPIEKYGEAAIVTATAAGKTDKYYTFSKVLIKQLKAIEPLIKEGKRVKAVLKRIKNYYTFT